MTKSLQLDGEFWLPDSPDTRVAGIVAFSPSEGTTLSLIGSFRDFMDMLNRLPSPNYRRIVGETILGDFRRVTLDDCLLAFENPFGRRQRFVVGRLLINAAYDQGESVELDQLEVRLSDLAGWLIEGVPPMLPDSAVLAKGSIPMTAITAEEVENIQLGNNVQLYLAHRISMTTDLGFMSLHQNSTAEFKFDSPVDLDSALDYAVDLLAALTIAADRVVEFEEISFSHPNLRQQSNSDKSVNLYIHWNVQADPNRKSW